MNIENLSGPKAFRATCPHVSPACKNLVIEAKHPHSSMAVPLEAKTGGISMQELNARLRARARSRIPITSEHESGTLVLLKGFYNVREVAALLHWSRGRVYTMAERKVDPLPIRRFEGRKRNYLIQREKAARPQPRLRLDEPRVHSPHPATPCDSALS